MVALPASHPAWDYAQALARAQAFMALDDAAILPQARTALLEHGHPTPLAVVLFHGFTNNPAQYAALAPLLYQRGVNVFVPRLPEHGDRDRMTTRIAKLTAESLLASANEAVDVACGLGERVGVLGISMGGTLAAYFAQFRKVGTAVVVAPDFALLALPYGASLCAGRILGWLPNFFLWWDPRAGIAQRPLTAYPRFSTHALAQTLRVGDDVYATVKHRRPFAERIVTIVNKADPAVNNEVAKTVSACWSRWIPSGVEYAELHSLPENHDIIDPQNPHARTDRVYPHLLSALDLSS